MSFVETTEFKPDAPSYVRKLPRSNSSYWKGNMLSATKLNESLEWPFTTAKTIGYSLETSLDDFETDHGHGTVSKPYEYH